MTTAYKNIQDAPVLGQTANAIAINYVTVTPFNSANVQYEVRAIQTPPSPEPVDPNLAPPMGNIPVSVTLMTGSLLLAGEDYSGWGDDDNYLYQKVAEKNGLTLLPDPAPQ
jgi:hypothetical protein